MERTEAVVVVARDGRLTAAVDTRFELSEAKIQSSQVSLNCQSVQTTLPTAPKRCSLLARPTLNTYLSKEPVSHKPRGMRWALPSRLPSIARSGMTIRVIELVAHIVAANALANHKQQLCHKCPGTGPTHLWEEPSVSTSLRRRALRARDIFGF